MAQNRQPDQHHMETHGLTIRSDIPDNVSGGHAYDDKMEVPSGGDSRKTDETG